VAREFTDVVFFIESTSNEQMNHWSEWSKESMSNIKSLPDSEIEKITDLSLQRKVMDLNRKVRRFEHPRVEWEQVMNGFSLTIGYVKKSPVCVSFSFAVINGKKVCFYDCTSQIADHQMIEDWLISRFQLTHDNYSRWNHTNSSNFHICVHGLDSLDEKPRNTVYVKS